MRVSIVEITPKSCPAYYIVTCARDATICRTFADPVDAITYRRSLDNR